MRIHNDEGYEVTDTSFECSGWNVKVLLANGKLQEVYGKHVEVPLHLATPVVLLSMFQRMDEMEGEATDIKIVSRLVVSVQKTFLIGMMCWNEKS